MFIPTNPIDLAVDGISIPKAKAVCLVIFLHGSEADEAEDFCEPKISPEGTVPPVIGALSGEKIGGKRILVFAPCSKSRGGPIWNGRQDYKFYKRGIELKSLLARFEAVGYDRRNIFLTGHSVGAWISLTQLAKFPGSVRGVIAFSPAFAGMNSARNERNPFWVPERARQVDLLQRTASLPSLIYAFEGDEWESQSELRGIFGKVPHAQLVEKNYGPARIYNRTPGIYCHNGVYTDRFIDQTPRTLQFIEERLP